MNWASVSREGIYLPIHTSAAGLGSMAHIDTGEVIFSLLRPPRHVSSTKDVLNLASTGFLSARFDPLKFDNEQFEVETIRMVRGDVL